MLAVAGPVVRMFQGYGKVIFCCCKKQCAQQGHDSGMLGRLAFPRIDNCKIVTVESDTLLPPVVTPSEGCGNYCKQFANSSCHWIDTHCESCWCGCQSW